MIIHYNIMSQTLYYKAGYHLFQVKGVLVHDPLLNIYHIITVEGLRPFNYKTVYLGMESTELQKTQFEKN